MTPQEIDEALAFVDEEARLDAELGVKPKTVAERYMHLLAKALRQSRQEAGELEAELAEARRERDEARAAVVSLRTMREDCCREKYESREKLKDAALRELWKALEAERDRFHRIHCGLLANGQPDCLAPCKTMTDVVCRTHADAALTPKTEDAR